MDFNKNIGQIIGGGISPTTKILKQQTYYNRNTGTQINYVDINNRIKQIFDRMPDVIKAVGYINIVLKNGKTLKVNVNYK